MPGADRRRALRADAEAAACADRATTSDADGLATLRGHALARIIPDGVAGAYGQHDASCTAHGCACGVAIRLTGGGSDTAAAQRADSDTDGDAEQWAGGGAHSGAGAIAIEGAVDSGLVHELSMLERWGVRDHTGRLRMRVHDWLRGHAV